jgi:hypothetical protein
VRHLVDATRNAVEQKNWYAALALALTLPDICGRISYPNLGRASERRVVRWFNKYLAAYYRGGPVTTQFMAGDDFYALRCAYLHQGAFSLDAQSAKKLLARFHLTVPGPGVTHCNRTANADAEGNLTNISLQLSVDEFCEEVCSAVEQWLRDVENDPRIQSEISRLGHLGDYGTL